MSNKLERITTLATSAPPLRAPALPPAVVELPEATGGFSLREFWRLMRARRAILAATAMIAILAASFYNYVTVPTYLATATIQIDREQPNIARLDDELSRMPERPDYIETQYKVLKSRTLARRVIQKLDLALLPELNRGLPPSRRSRASVSADEIDPLIVDAFLTRLHVDPGKGTRLVAVSFESEDRNLSPAAVNTLAGEYIEHNLEAKWNNTQKASSWLQQQLASLQDMLEASESLLHEYAAKHSILFVEERKDITSEKLARLESELTAAQAERIEKQSLSLLVEDAVRAGQDLPAHLTNPPLQQLRAKSVELRGELQKLLVGFGPSYPRVLRVESESAEIERSIREEKLALLGRVREEFDLAQRREKLLRDAAQQQRGLVNQLSEDFIQYDILKREAESNRQLYEGLLQRLKEAGVSAGLRASNIAVLDPAEIPEHPYRPRRLLNLLLALLCGLMTGVAIAFGAEHFSTRLRTPDEVERLTGLDLLAVLPKRKQVTERMRARLRLSGGKVSVSLRRPQAIGAVLTPLAESRQTGTIEAGGGAADGSSPLETTRVFSDSPPPAHAAIAGPPASLIPVANRLSTNNGKTSNPIWDVEAGLSEAYRSLRSTILLGWDGSLNRLLITSAHPQEGKTTVSLNLACSLAQLGRNVLLIDADMRRPNCARQLGVPAAPGLSAYLRGTIDLDGIIVPTPVDHLSLVPAGSAESSASDLLCSPRLAELLEHASARYHHTIIDTPPSLMLSDARTISRHVEGVMLVVSDQTDRNALLRTKQSFDDAGIRLVGFVMNRVNLANLDYGYYRQYGYYYAYGEKNNF